MNQNFLLLGPAGSGKSLQAKKLALALRLYHIDLENTLKETIQLGGMVGQRIEHMLLTKAPLDESDLLHLVQKEIDTSSAITNGFVLSGFPYSISQAEAFYDLLEDERRQLSKVFFLHPQNVKGSEENKSLLEEYQKSCAQVLKFYRDFEMLVEIDASQEESLIFEEILAYAAVEAIPFLKEAKA